MNADNAYEAWLNARKKISPDTALADRVMAEIELEQESGTHHLIPSMASYPPLSRIAVAAMIVGALGLQILRIACMAFCIFRASETGF